MSQKYGLWSGSRIAERRTKQSGPVLNLLAVITLLVWGSQVLGTGVLRVFGETLRRFISERMGSGHRAIKFYLTQVFREPLSQPESSRWTDIVSFAR